MTINRNNYESYFLLYADRELSASDERMVETFARQHPDLEKELAELRLTISAPPALIYPDKENLYRTERRRQVPLIWWSGIAASALVLLVSGWLLLVNGRRPVKTNTGNGEQAGAKLIPKAKDREETISLGENKPLTADNHPAAADRAPLAAHHSKPAVKPAGPGNRNLTAKNRPEKTVSHPENTAGADEQPRVIAAASLPTLAPNRSQVYQPSTINYQLNRPAFAEASAGKAEASANVDAPATNESSILIFNSDNSPIGAILNKTAKASPATGAKADQHRRRLNIGAFQFDLK